MIVIIRFTRVQLWVVAESMTCAPSPRARTASATSPTLPASPSSSLPPSVTQNTSSRRRHRLAAPVSIPTLSIINSSAATPSRSSSPILPPHAYAAAISGTSGTSGTSLSLASTFIVAGQSRVITALPSDAAVTRLPKHLSQAAARALHPNLQVYQRHAHSLDS